MLRHRLRHGEEGCGQRDGDQGQSSSSGRGDEPGRDVVARDAHAESHRHDAPFDETGDVGVELAVGVRQPHSGDEEHLAAGQPRGGVGEFGGDHVLDIAIEYVIPSEHGQAQVSAGRPAIAARRSSTLHFVEPETHCMAILADARRDDLDHSTDLGATERREAIDVTNRLQNYIDGAFVDSASTDSLDIVNPADESVVAVSPVSTADEVAAAVAAAQRAQVSWGRTTPGQRQKALLALADAIEERADEIVAAQVRNTGQIAHLVKSEEVLVSATRSASSPAPPDCSRAEPEGEYGGLHQLRAPRANRPGGPGDAVELPVHDGDLEDRARAGRRQFDRSQAQRHHPESTLVLADP